MPDSPSTHQDSPKVPEKRWPAMELVRREGDSDLVQPWVPGPGENDLSGFEVEDYIPVSALISDEVEERVAKALCSNAGPGFETDWIALSEAGRDAYRFDAKAALQAAIQAVSGGDDE